MTQTTMSYVPFIACFLLGAVTVAVLWEMFRTRHIIRVTLDILEEEIAATTTTTPQSGVHTIPAVCVGGPLDGYEFDADAEVRTALVNGNRYDFTARSAEGRWIYKHNH